MKLSLSESDNNAWGDPDKRYDENADEKFDFGERIRPDSALFQQFDELLNYASTDCPLPPTFTVRLAEIALQTRNLVGIVLGSTVNTLWHIRKRKMADKLSEHGDLDVLILNPHSPANPYPHEWSVDWWVRPEGKPPTNGNTNLWYDLELAPGYKIEQPAKYPASPIDIEIDRTEAGPQFFPDRCRAIRKISEALQTGVSKTLAPGLYLPDGRTMSAIKKHAVSKETEALEEFYELFYETHCAIFTFCHYDKDSSGIRQFKIHFDQLYNALNRLEKICAVFGSNAVSAYMPKFIEQLQQTTTISNFHALSTKLLESIHRSVETQIWHKCQYNSMPDNKPDNDILQKRALERALQKYKHLSIDPVSNIDMKTPLPVLPSHALVFKPL